MFVKLYCRCELHNLSGWKLSTVHCCRAIFATRDALGYLHAPFVLRWKTFACRQRKTDVKHHGDLIGRRGRRHLHEQNVKPFFV